MYLIPRVDYFIIFKSMFKKIGCFLPQLLLVNFYSVAFRTFNQYECGAQTWARKAQALAPQFVGS